MKRGESEFGFKYTHARTHHRFHAHTDVSNILYIIYKLKQRNTYMYDIHIHAHNTPL